MRAAVLETPNEPLVIAEVGVEDPRAGEVAVRVHACGVCHSDLHAMTGSLPQPAPVVLGHEGAGVITAVGAGVDNLAEGDHVVVEVEDGALDFRVVETGEFEEPARA